MHQSRPNTLTKSKEGRHRDHTNPNLTCELRSEDRKWRGPSFEEPKERMHLRNALVSHLHQKAGHCGRRQRRASKEEGLFREGSHCLHIQCIAPTKMATFMRKRHPNNSSIAHHSLPPLE